METSDSGHRYLSTACLHAIFDEKLHAACRVTCKYCESKCVCPCHMEKELDVTPVA